MNGAQLHLALNHFPVVTSVLSLLLLVWAWLSKSPDLRKAGLLFVVLGALFAGGAYLTGDPAEDVLKVFPGFSRNLVHEHEEAAEFALIIDVVSAAVALASLFFAGTKRKVSHYAFIAAIALTALSSAIFLRTAHLGGLIKHDEIREPAIK